MSQLTPEQIKYLQTIRDVPLNTIEPGEYKVAFELKELGLVFVTSSTDVMFASITYYGRRVLAQEEN